MFTMMQATSFIRQLNPAIGVLLLGLGLVLILQGQRLQRPAIMLSLMAVAFCAVWHYGYELNYRLHLGFVAALVIGAGAFFLSRFGLALLAGLVGLGLTMAGAAWIGVSRELVIVFGAGGFIALAGMSFVNWRELAAFVTSLEGGILLICGIGSMMSLKPNWFVYWNGMVAHNSLFLPIAIFFPTITGFFLQLAAIQRSYSGAEQL